MSYEVKQLLVIFCFFVLPGIVGAWIASTKGRNTLGWFFICAFFPPTIMAIIIQSPIKEVEGHYRECPACRELQSWKLSACKYCGAAMTRAPHVHEE
ncbi:hypothetical protein OR1_02417 [Geobacter sp. OR-1]|uniref:hypothetical protein n=1 Tax=Geobacter sp. OR-1 TaxID=1266765 RepID=UPI000542D12A|nr:hypothetical protein [Geobacter sp. OR-1]GAM10129.1 hypothetical protein OR1_02417 [Geobacter sp. OR-1]